MILYPIQIGFDLKFLYSIKFLLFLQHINQYITPYRTGMGYCCVISMHLEQLEKNLCKTKVCHNYAKCIVEEQNGFVTKCVCPNECEEEEQSVINTIEFYQQTRNKNYTFNSNRQQARKQRQRQEWQREHRGLATSSRRVVCGSDGRDYVSFCELKKQSCIRNKEIRVVYMGKCSKLI
jgi:hypothetical protein